MLELITDVFWALALRDEHAGKEVAQVAEASDVAKILLESAMDDRLDFRVEVAASRL